MTSGRRATAWCLASPQRSRPRLLRFQAITNLRLTWRQPPHLLRRKRSRRVHAAAAHAQNNFNLLRLLFALMVVVYHAIALPGLAGWENAEAWTSIGAEIGVQGFFVLSGYLVWASLERSASLGVYAEKRARRLLPGYVAVVLVCAIAAVDPRSGRARAILRRWADISAGILPSSTSWRRACRACSKPTASPRSMALCGR